MPDSKDVIIVKVLIQPGEGEGGVGGEEQNQAQGWTGPRTAQDVEAHLAAHVEGTGAPFSDEVLAQTTDWAKVRKYYKLNGVAWVDAIKDESARRREMEMLVLGSMALRGL